MSGLFDQDRREYVRVRADISVRYKFLTKQITDPRLEDIYQGMTNNISGGGILLSGIVPDVAWVPELLMQRIVIGVNFILPDESEVIKALTRASWIEALNETTHQCLIGLKFKEITTPDRDRIFKYIIRSQLPS